MLHNTYYEFMYCHVYCLIMGILCFIFVYIVEPDYILARKYQTWFVVSVKKGLFVKFNLTYASINVKSLI